MEREESSSNTGIPSPLDFNISQHFTHYEKLHSSELNCVYRAERYGKWYVLKGIAPEHASDPVYMSILEKEFEQAVTLDHPNIAHVYGLERDEVAGCCMVMEYVEGRSLTQFLEEKPSAKKRYRVVMQLLDAMEYFHARQTVHRDLKPSNIFVTTKGDNVKVLDFGLSDRDDYAVLKGPAYSHGYAAPEQMEAGKEVDCRADIYAFGVILRMLFPHRYGRIVGRCKRRNPADRYSSASEVKAAIGRYNILSWALPLVLLLCLIASGVTFVATRHTLPKDYHVYTYDFSSVSPSGHTLYYVVHEFEKVRTIKGCEGHDCISGKLIIPERVEWEGRSFTVTELSGSYFGSFQSYLNMTEVEIPNTVTVIGMNAFCSSGLTTVTIPNSVTHIGAYAFNYCQNLRTVTIGEGVESIGQKVFWRCTALDTIRCLGKVPPKIEDDTFLDANKCIAVVVPDGSVEAYRQAWGGDFEYVGSGI
ncbi:MAG: protein kinase [Bacteroidales bacterium]|nr:protein kinase [Bacteroidales bacterium]